MYKMSSSSAAKDKTKRKSGGGQRNTHQNGPSSDKPVHSAPSNEETSPKLLELAPECYGEELQDTALQGANAIPLTEEYQQQVRPFIDLIDKLRAYGLDQDVRLPAVAVIGDQSAGKSSTLEAISGIQLPRGKGIVTRCPLVLRLKSTVPQPGYWRGQIQYKDANDEEIEKQIDDPIDVSQFVEEAQNAIAGKSKGISKKLITLDVVSEHVPDLTLIDLPGITRIAVEDQPQDIGDQIKALITERIEQQETIILAVVPANVDIATNEALQLARTFDEQGERTLGVVTKPDLVDPGAESELIAVLHNESYHLEKGYTCVKCRGQLKLDDKQTLAEALEEEERFFQSKKHFRDVDENILGVRNLSKKLTYELVEQIRKTIPTLKAEVERKAEDTRYRLDKLGAGLPEDKGQVIAYVMRLLTHYTDRVKHECEHALFKRARDMFQELMMDVSAKCPDTKDNTFMRQVKEECVKNRGNELPRFMNYEVFKGLTVNIIDRYIQVNHTCVDKVSKMMDKAIVDLVDEEFAHLPRLAGEVKRKVTGVRQKAYETCKDRLNEIICMEKLVFTQDRIFNKDLESLREQHADKTGKADESKPSEPVRVERSHRTATITAARWFDGVDQDYEQTIAEDMCEMIKAFIEVSNRRMVDYVPLTISLHLIENLWKNIREEVPLMATDNEIIQVAKEDNRTVTERKKLRQKLERLERAHTELVGY